MDIERKDEGELTPEEMQEKADEAREAFEEIDEASVGVVNDMAKLPFGEKGGAKRIMDWVIYGKNV